METNVREGSEDARQIAPAVHATPETRRVWIGLAIVVALALLLPGCGEGEGAESMSAFDVGSILLGVVGIAAGLYALMSRDDAKARRDELALANSKIAQMSRAHRREITETQDASDKKFTAERTARNAADAEVRALRALRALDAAALDACAELLSGPNAPGEHTAARVALRATGRLGGATAEPKP